MEAWLHPEIEVYPTPGSVWIMASDLDVLRSEMEGTFNPPIDVMLDPSLLVAATTRTRLADSSLFNAQTQATLGQNPSQPRVDGLHIPASFHDLLHKTDQSDVSTRTAWNYFRGQAESGTVDEIVETLDGHRVEPFDRSTSTGLNWAAALEEPEQSEALISILREICAFLDGGGLLLSRTSKSLDALRDAGIATIDIGHAEIRPEIRSRLRGIGFRDPAPVCAFGVSSTTELARALVGDLLTTHGNTVLYCLGG